MTTTGEQPQATRTPGELIDAVLQLMPDPAVVVDGNGVIVAANALAERQFDYRPGAMTGLTIESLVPERLRQRHIRHRAAYAAKPTPRAMGAGLSLLALRSDGSEFPVDISLAPLGVPERPLAMAAIRDMSVQRAQWEVEARLAAIVASSDDAIVAFDLAGTITSCNPAAERLFGYENADLMGRSFWRLVPPEQHHDVEERMARVRAGLRVMTHDTMRVHRGGRHIDVAETLSLVPDAGGAPAGFAAIVRDVTERKRAELELRHLLTETQRRERWLRAMSDLRMAQLGGTPPTEWLERVMQRVCELTDADGALVVLPTDHDPELLHVAATRGEGHAVALGDEVPVERSLSGRVFRSGTSVVADDYQSEVPTDIAQLAGPSLGPIVLTPMATSSGPAGVLVVTRASGREGFSPEDVRLIESFAQQAGFGLELERAQDERSQFVVLADRERIARDLHDHVIQRLFAVGMALQAAAHSISDDKALERIESSVEELDDTIRSVRSTIFSLELQLTEHVETSTRARILEVASAAAGALGFQPLLHFDGPIDTRVPQEMVHDILAVVRESLSNSARHAQASNVEIRVRAAADLLIEVIDDGKGASGRTRSSGLTNLRVRAEARGGTLHVGEGRKGRGTRLVWQVPIP